MERIEILKQLEEIFRDVFDDEEIELSESTTSDDIEDWDSITHVQLISEIQKAFRVKFSAKEMLKWKKVDDILNALR